MPQNMQLRGDIILSLSTFTSIYDKNYAGNWPIRSGVPRTE
jgi:hypothetical protein